MEHRIPVGVLCVHHTYLVCCTPPALGFCANYSSLREFLFDIYNKWKHPIIVSEFGFPVYGEATKDLPDQLFDSPRSQYYLSFMSEVLKSIYEDGVEVIGALAWSFADNWEFGDYSQQFGMQVVNRTTQKRHYKKSFFDLVDFVKSRQHSN